MLYIDRNFSDNQEIRNEAFFRIKMLYPYSNIKFKRIVYQYSTAILIEFNVNDKSVFFKKETPENDIKRIIIDENITNLR